MAKIFYESMLFSHSAGGNWNQRELYDSKSHSPD